MKKSKEFGYQLVDVIWNNINEFPDLWKKTEIQTKEKIVNKIGELAIELVNKKPTK